MFRKNVKRSLVITTEVLLIAIIFGTAFIEISHMIKAEAITKLDDKVVIRSEIVGKLKSIRESYKDQKCGVISIKAENIDLNDVDNRFKALKNEELKLEVRKSGNMYICSSFGCSKIDAGCD